MRIGFYLRRITYLKTMGALIKACVERAYNVFLYYEHVGRISTNKAYQAVSPEILSGLGVDRKHILMLDNFSQMPKEPQMDVMVLHEGYHTLKSELHQVEALRKRGTIMVSLAHFFEMAKQPIAALDHFDLTVYPSEFCRQLHFELHGGNAGHNRVQGALPHNTLVAGSPMFDQIEEISRNQARQELKIDRNAKVVLLIAPVISLVTPWRYYVWGEGNKLQRTVKTIRANKSGYLWEIWTGSQFEETVAAIRSFCDREGALLVVKSRGKQGTPAYLAEAADFLADGYQDVYYPVFTTYSLLAAADVCIAVNSMAAVEAVAAGIPCINIYVPHQDRIKQEEQDFTGYYEGLLSGRPQSLMNFQGCIQRVDRRRVAKTLAHTTMAEFQIDPQARRAYAHRFLGIEEKPSSIRILERLEEMVQAEPSVA